MTVLLRYFFSGQYEVSKVAGDFTNVNPKPILLPMLILTQFYDLRRRCSGWFDFDCQKQMLDIFLDGHNTFVAGVTSCGKSFVLKQISEGTK